MRISASILLIIWLYFTYKTRQKRFDIGIIRNIKQTSRKMQEKTRCNQVFKQCKIWSQISYFHLRFDIEEKRMMVIKDSIQLCTGIEWKRTEFIQRWCLNALIMIIWRKNFLIPTSNPSVIIIIIINLKKIVNKTRQWFSVIID